MANVKANCFNKYYISRYFPLSYLCIALVAFHGVYILHAEGHLKSSDEKYRITALMLVVELFSSGATAVLELFSGSFLFGILPLFDLSKFFTTKFLNCSLATTLFVGMFWRYRRKAFIRQVSSLRITTERRTTFFFAFRRILFASITAAISFDILLGYCVMEEIPNFEMIASGAGTCVTLFAGLFYIYEYFSFFVLVRSLANSNMPGILDSVGFKRMKAIGHEFLLTSISLILHALSLSSAIPLGDSLYTPAGWCAFWGSFHTTRLLCSYFKIATVFPKADGKVAAVTILVRKKSGSRKSTYNVTAASSMPENSIA